jgi:hypothetical protein
MVEQMTNGVGKRNIARSKYYNIKDRFRKNNDRSLIKKLYYYLGQWRGLHQKFIQEQRYSRKFRKNNTYKLQVYHRNYYKKRKARHGKDK